MKRKREEMKERERQRRDKTNKGELEAIINILSFLVIILQPVVALSHFLSVPYQPSLLLLLLLLLLIPLIPLILMNQIILSHLKARRLQATSSNTPLIQGTTSVLEPSHAVPVSTLKIYCTNNYNRTTLYIVCMYHLLAVVVYCVSMQTCLFASY